MGQATETISILEVCEKEGNFTGKKGVLRHENTIV